MRLLFWRGSDSHLDRPYESRHNDRNYVNQGKKWQRRKRGIKRKSATNGKGLKEEERQWRREEENKIQKLQVFKIKRIALRRIKLSSVSCNRHLANIQIWTVDFSRRQFKQGIPFSSFLFCTYFRRSRHNSIDIFKLYDIIEILISVLFNKNVRTHKCSTPCQELWNWNVRSTFIKMFKQRRIRWAEQAAHTVDIKRKQRFHSEHLMESLLWKS